MPLFRKKPIVIEAWRITPETRYDLPFPLTRNADDSGFLINTLEGLMGYTWGDYVIRGIKGELYPCKPDIFEATYEAVGDDAE